MKKHFLERIQMLAIALAVSVTLAACGGVEPTAPESGTPAAETSAAAETAGAEATVAPESSGTVAPTADVAPDFTYEFQDETYDQDGRKIVFPQLINANDPAKADLVNDVIQEELKAYLLEVDALAKDVGAISLDLAWSSESFGNNALTIIYKGISTSDGAAYPQNVYRTTVINLLEPASIQLTDAFDVGGDFAARLRDGMYAPTQEGLDLEASSVDIVGLIDDQGDTAELAKQLQTPGTPFVLTSLGVIVSIPVPHATGDHLEMALPYESVEPLMKRDTCTVWTGYLAMSDNAGASETAEGTILYENARFGYGLHYPDLFGAPVESDNGDGITLESADGKVTLLIWAANNLEATDGAKLLEQTKESIAGIVSESTSDRFYRVDFEGGDADPIRFVECGYAGDAASLHFRMSYPAADETKYESAVTAMANELKVP